VRRLLITVIMVCKSEDPREQFDDESRRQDKHIIHARVQRPLSARRESIQKATEKDEIRARIMTTKNERKARGQNEWFHRMRCDAMAR
jgi:hypothetical protein